MITNSEGNEIVPRKQNSTNCGSQEFSHELNASEIPERSFLYYSLLLTILDFFVFYYFWNFFLGWGLLKLGQQFGFWS